MDSHLVYSYPTFEAFQISFRLKDNLMHRPTAMALKIGTFKIIIFDHYTHDTVKRMSIIVNNAKQVLAIKHVFINSEIEQGTN